MNPTRPWLLPLVPLYRLGLAVAKSTSGKPRRLARPVVSIGNLSTGGTGKTPLTIALAKALATRGVHVDVLSRGYGRRSALPLVVNPEGAAEEFGDEPLVIAREAGVPVYVAADRYQAGLLAESEQPAAVLKGHGFSRAANATEKEGALAPARSLHLLDDGFQHHRLARNIDILLLDRRDWTDSLLPAGNLREPREAARRASVIAIPASDPNFESELRSWGWRKTIWRLHRRMDVPSIDGPVAAFCGIARPEQFFAGLKAAGVHVASRTTFPDHHPYIQHDIDCLLDAARNVGAKAFITTEKDRSRLADLLSKLSVALPLKTAQLYIDIEDEQSAVDWLMAHVYPVASS